MQIQYYYSQICQKKRQNCTFYNDFEVSEEQKMASNYILLWHATD